MAPPRARQSRLTFTPLPSSSPAAKGYHQQIQDRAAAVTIDTPAKRRKTRHRGDDDINSLDGANDTIPTPAASLEKPHRDSGSDSEAIRPSRRSQRSTAKKARKPRQQHLDFSSTRDRETFSSPVRLASSPSRPQSSGRPGIFSSQRPRRVVDDTSESEDELPSAQELVSKSRKGRARREKESSGRRMRSSAPITTVRSDSEDNIVVGNDSSNAIQVDSEEDDDDMPTTIGAQRRKRQRRGSFNSFISSSPPRMVDSESDIEIVERPNKRRRQEASEEEDEPITSRRQRQMSQREKDELAEDLEDLQSSGPEEDDEDDDDDDEAGVRPPGTQSSQKMVKGLALERLRRKREGTVSEVQTISDGDEDEEEEDQRPMSSARFFRGEEDYDKEFIEEEDEHDNVLGVPDGVPLQFTRYASMRPKELFRFAVDWMVQKRMNPGFQMRDEIYELTFKKLDDETKGLVGSKFVSSAWTSDFASALKARPEIAFEPLDRHSAEHYMRDKCDACNRSGHPATFQIQFQGIPYHLDTLEEVGVNDDDDSDSESDSDGPSTRDRADTEPAYDSLGNEIVPAVYTFYVGKFCMSNAQTAHALQHWRFHLNEYVATWLTRQGYDTPEALHKLNKLSTKKRGKRAGKIVKRMEEEGVVKQLWQDFKQNIDEARNAKQGGRF